MPSTSISRSVKGRYLPVSNTGNRCSSAEPLPPLFSYFPASTLIVNTGDLEASAERFQNEARARFENRGVDPMRPLLPPELLWLRSDEAIQRTEKMAARAAENRTSGGQSGKY